MASGSELSFTAEDARKAVGELVAIIEVNVDAGAASHNMSQYLILLLIYIFQQNFTGFNVSEIIKAGSMGHGTAVPGHFDIDLVLYSRGKILFYSKF
jgi:hypothetical protein